MVANEVAIMRSIEDHFGNSFPASALPSVNLNRYIYPPGTVPPQRVCALPSVLLNIYIYPPGTVLPQRAPRARRHLPA